MAILNFDIHCVSVLFAGRDQDGLPFRVTTLGGKRVAGQSRKRSLRLPGDERPTPSGPIPTERYRVFPEATVLLGIHSVAYMDCQTFRSFTQLAAD